MLKHLLPAVLLVSCVTFGRSGTAAEMLVAIGRKNWLFFGSVAAGERMADLITLVSSALRHDLDVWAYVKNVLDQLLAGSTDYASLRPDRWAASHPEHIRTLRADERRDRAAKQHHRRARRRSAKRNPS